MPCSICGKCGHNKKTCQVSAVAEVRRETNIKKSKTVINKKLGVSNKKFSSISKTDLAFNKPKPLGVCVVIKDAKGRWLGVKDPLLHKEPKKGGAKVKWVKGDWGTLMD